MVTIDLVTQRIFLLENIPTSRPFFSKQQTSSKSFISEIINDIVFNSYHLILFFLSFDSAQKNACKVCEKWRENNTFSSF
jgi:hypothetical protein